MSDVEWAWAAGLFEGEGSIVGWQTSPGRISVKLVIGSTDKDVMERFCAIVDGLLYGPYHKANRKPIYHCRVSGYRKLESIFRRFAPFLGERRTQRFKELLAMEPPPYTPRNRKLTGNQVEQVRKRLARGDTCLAVAAHFSVSRSLISGIKLGTHRASRASVKRMNPQIDGDEQF